MAFSIEWTFDVTPKDCSAVTAVADKINVGVAKMIVDKLDSQAPAPTSDTLEAHLCGGKNSDELKVLQKYCLSAGGSKFGTFPLTENKDTGALECSASSTSKKARRLETGSSLEYSATYTVQAHKEVSVENVQGMTAAFAQLEKDKTEFVTEFKTYLDAGDRTKVKAGSEAVQKASSSSASNTLLSLASVSLLLLF